MYYGSRNEDISICCDSSSVLLRLFYFVLEYDSPPITVVVHDGQEGGLVLQEV